MLKLRWNQAVSLLALTAVTCTGANAADFKSDPASTSKVLGDWMPNAPVYFTVPESAWLPLPKEFSVRSDDQLVEFRHPDGIDTPARPGLRIIATHRKGFGAEMARSGLLQPGDLLLWYEPSWAGGGPYPNVQMGIDHAGMVFLKDGNIRNIDNPIANPNYYSPNEFGGPYHDRFKFLLHVVRPRGLTDRQRTNISKWSDRFLTVVAKKFYGNSSNPADIYSLTAEADAAALEGDAKTEKSDANKAQQEERLLKENDAKLFRFDPHYDSPLYKPGAPLTFVQRLGQIGLTPPDAKISRSSQQPPVDMQTMFCAEFAWSVLALRDCDPDDPADAAALNGSTMPACIKPIMTPLPATGHYLSKNRTTQDIGLADGPMIAIDALNRPADQTSALIDNIFEVAPNSPFANPKFKGGQYDLARKLSPAFALLKPYYKAVMAGGIEGYLASVEGMGLRTVIASNYSPTSYLVNTMLPADDVNRTMDYVVSIKFLPEPK